MLNDAGFDLWADGYDRTVALTEEADEYPFAGYKQVLGKIYQAVRASEREKSLLDVGFGTAVLTSRLYDDGYSVTGIDFSERMIEIARSRMPRAELYRCDFSKEFPQELMERRFESIVSTYALHHLTPEEKPAFLNLLVSRLEPWGQLLIGDVAFQTRRELELCRERAGEGWDEDEFYFVLDELRPRLNAEVRFEAVSHCAGILTIRPQ